MNNWLLYKLLPYALQTSKRIKCSKVQDVLHNCGQNAEKIPVRQRARDIDHCGRLSDAIRAQAAAFKKNPVITTDFNYFWLNINLHVGKTH